MPYPKAPSDFKGTIGTTIAESEPYFERRRHPGSDSPNVAIVVLDDVGFSQFSCYGSDFDTRHIVGLAANGFKFTHFHVACSVAFFEDDSFRVRRWDNPR